MSTSPLTIVIPIYNEARRLTCCMTALEWFHDEAYLFDVLFVENGSTDESYQIVNEYALTHEWVSILQTAPGKGRALRAGVLAAEGDFIYTADCDFSTPLPYLFSFVENIPKADIVIGSRALQSSQVKTTLKRRVIGRVFHSLVASIVPGFQDTQCGFKLYRREAARALFSSAKLDGFAIDVEILYLAQRFGYRIKEIPVRWKHDPDSRVDLVKDSFKMLRDVLRIPGLHAKLPKLLPA
jgi:dolichyl-phosphate beta-glucosyltransferase